MNEEVWTSGEDKLDEAEEQQAAKIQAEVEKKDSITIEELETELDYETLKLKFDESEKRAAEYLDGWQRARAEFANAKKRLDRERAEARQNAAVEYAKRLLPILDDFQRAMDNAPSEIETNAWFEGLILIQRKLLAILGDLNVEQIEAIDQPFDPNFHEALGMFDVEGIESGIVIEELQVGYKVGDKVIRPSLVNVAA